MITEHSRQHKKAFCQKAKQRDHALPRLYDKRAIENRYREKDQLDMGFNTFIRPSPGQINDNVQDYQPASMRSYDPAPTSPCDRSPYTFPVVTQPASRTEIYGLALGTCFLVLLMIWLVTVGIRTSMNHFKIFNKKPNDVDRTLDPESGIIHGGNILEWQQFPEERKSFLSNMRTVSAESWIKLARRSSAEFVAGFKDMDVLKRLKHPAHILDEEAALGMNNGQNDSGGSFLHRPGWTAGVLSAQRRK
ncbi:hypothetical protein F5Y04DRAFT_117496 [Hypomontagnella monticulosa]|nr:hypothetical protein F5Y04DRAFT_117496 [Hypomontagnella monticulosa]